MSIRRQMKELQAENEALKAQLAEPGSLYDATLNATIEENKELKVANEEGQKDFSMLQTENEALKALPDDPARKEREDLQAKYEALKNKEATTNTIDLNRVNALQKQIESLIAANDELKEELNKTNQTLAKLENTQAPKRKKSK